MRRILYIVGAGLTKSLERPPQRVPLMTDFVPVMADHLDDDVILTLLAALENADLFQYPSAEAKLITHDLASMKDRSQQAIAQFKEILKSRPPESIEVLLERARKGLDGDDLPMRFNFAINRLFCRIGYNLNVKPLLGFLRRQFRIRNARHTFVSFNYDLALDHCVQRTSNGRWNVQRGYGFEIRYYIDPGEGAKHVKQFERVGGAFSALSAMELNSVDDDCPITILKPHGSLNFIFPFDGNYNFKNGATITVLTERADVAYHAGFDLQHVALPGSEPQANRGLYLVPPTFSKSSQLEVIEAVREKHRKELEAADEIYVIGWSMPPTDEDQQEFISHAMERRSRPIDRLVIINYGAPCDYFERLSATFRVSEGRIEIYNSGFTDFVKRTSSTRFENLGWLLAGLVTLLGWALRRRRS